MIIKKSPLHPRSSLLKHGVLYITLWPKETEIILTSYSKYEKDKIQYYYFFVLEGWMYVLRKWDSF